MFVKFASLRTVYQARKSNNAPTPMLPMRCQPGCCILRTRPLSTCQEPQYDPSRKHHTRPPSTNEFVCHRYYNPPFP
ncbi:hypothetical protein PISMIDRAFT_682745 [Pisolithus microcarpus 441]|uniref:Uncharacterized protein n=1 Tax=Pisolithus microcarpus 441 TaxID=765257 RepID=A0A0C9ZC53_9AGAM|nr:hypothetical protein PISMIDRAFT_682745 [Pisolithus microcarpus 441]